MIALLLTRFIVRKADFDEWVVHHLSLGFGRVHVFDNGVPFNLEEACLKYDREQVSYEKVEGPVCQYKLYERYIKGCSADYVMPIDDDEYLWLAPEFDTIGDLLEHYGNPDCFGIRWKYMFPKRFDSVRNVPVLKYCTEQNKKAARFFCMGGDRMIKCIVRPDQFVKYIPADDGNMRDVIPVTLSDEGALLCDGRRVKKQIVTIDGYEPVRLLHCPYKGYSEFLNTRGSERPSVCRQRLFMRKDNVRFLKWLEENYERQTA